MTLKHFQKLSGHKQYRELLGKGVHIAERRSQHAEVLLFQVAHFYTEVFFDPNTDEVSGARSFENTEELYPYLEQIDLGALLS